MRISWMRQRGITLIEMMLVVTVIAVATLSTIKILRSRLSTTAIDQLVIQMQNVAQGTINYYMLNNAWPTTATTPSSLLSLTNGTGTNPINTIFFPSATLCTPLVDRRQRSGLCNGYSLIEGQALNSATYYQLVLETHNSDVATALANQLPDAQVANNTKVVMSLLAPAQNFLKSKLSGWIVSAGVISFSSEAPSGFSGMSWNSQLVFAGTAVVLPNCPVEFEGHVIFIPFRYQYGSDFSPNWHIGQLGINTTHGIVQESNNSSLTSIPGFTGSTAVYDASLSPQNVPQERDSTGTLKDVYAVRLADYYSPKDSYHDVGYYLTMCLPLGHWTSSGVDQSSLQDGQCTDTDTVDTSWTTFLKTANPTVHERVVTCQSLAGASNSIPNLPLGSPNAY